MFKRHLLSSSIAMATAFGGMSSAVLAQDSKYDAEIDESAALEEVVVTGVRASLSKAIDIKRDKFQIVDSIVAEDIGKFPDNNVVEALQRVTGVQVTDRGAGEVSTVAIRGLNDVTTTVNGRQIFTASGRSVALADVPASLLRGVEVYKTRDASQISSGIAGQIDIRTNRPFDFDGSKVVLAGRNIYQEQSESNDPNFSGMFANSWEGDFGKFGALVNLSYAETNYRDQSITPGAAVPFVTGDAPEGWVPYERIQVNDGRVAEAPVWEPGLESGLPYSAGSTLTMNGEEVGYVLGRDAVFASDFTGKRERPAANISLQWAPNESSEYLFEAFYNGYRNESFNSLNFTFVDWWGDNTHLPMGGEVELFDGTNVVKSRDVAAPYGFTSGDIAAGKTDSFVYALGGNWDISDSFRLSSELIYQDSTFEESFVAMRFDRVAYGLGVDFNTGNGEPALEFYDNPETPDVDESDLTDAAQWNVAQLYDNGGSREGDAVTFKLDGELDVNWGAINQVSFGLRHEGRFASESTRGQEGFLGRNAAEFNENLVSINNNFYDGRADIPLSWAAPNGHYIHDNIDEFRTLYGLSAEPLLTTFELDEDTTSVYAQASYETEVAGRILDGQFGVRYVNTSRDMEFFDVGILDENGNPVGTSGSGSNSKLLPSLMVRYAITEDLFARLAYTTTLQRPGFTQLNPWIYYAPSVTNTNGTASAGNPDLEPVESQNIDLSLEWYFGEASALYGTLFRRDIEGFFYDAKSYITHQAETETEPSTYVLTTPGNTSNGVLQGLELGATYFPENLPGILDGFGIQASYTMLDSEQEVPVYDDLSGALVGMEETPIFGVSDSSYSVVFAYDKNDLDMRLSYVWRDDFLANYEARIFANPLGVYRQAEVSMDFQASYDVSDNLVVTFDATNLTDEEYRSYYENADVYNLGNAIFSRTFALGARYSF
ncbi:TonB-dependent receptor [Microbulbifer sp. CAU 1566]|uniref:TonB-dependent receptor n=1 Tax=Microbulbifer sp. CAU 1566 TaxID=2933269 RepID=UPI00200468F2|nr:TonB-dependent receptor [Microbulbifer sp. CAU 1566]MCK7596305.1 TonB-dependent receptor [Microbulbifer sp. CAU 1566]